MSAMENKEGKKKKNIFSPIVKYFKEVKSELKKVVFPTAKQTRINTTVVIIVVIVVGIIIGILDFAFNSARNAIIKDEEVQTEQTVDNTATEEEYVPTLEEAQQLIAELDSYTYDEEGNAVDENGDVMVLDDGTGTTVELTAENVEQIRVTAQSIIDAAAAAEVEATDVEATEETDAPEGGNE